MNGAAILLVYIVKKVGPAPAHAQEQLVFASNQSRLHPGYRLEAIKIRYTGRLPIHLWLLIYVIIYNWKKRVIGLALIKFLLF